MYFIKKNVYTSKKDNSLKCYLTVYDETTDQVLNLGAARGLDVNPVIEFVSTLRFGSKIGLAISAVTFNGQSIPVYTAVGPLK